jgi:dihydrolipoamide dehydrogenase
MVDLIVIGGGPGGYVAAERAGALGKKVLMIEKSHLGGVCLNEGCIPTKTLLNSAKLYKNATNSESFGVKVEGASFDLNTAMNWKQKVIDTLRKGIAFKMKHHNVEVINGNGKLINKNTVDVDGTTYQAKNIIIATGSSPFVPPIPGADQDHVVTSTGILNIEELPKKIAIVGGGVIGMEFASFFNSVGVEVEVYEMLPKIIPFMDQDLMKLLTSSMKKVKVITEAKVTSIGKNNISYEHKGESKQSDADVVLMSVGRTPNTTGLGLEDLNIEFDRSGIRVDDKMCTNIPGIYAIGDVNGKSLLAHSASRMGEVAVAHMFERRPMTMRYHAIPWVVYTNPEIAGCGITETQAKEQNIPVETASLPMKASGRFLAENGLGAKGLCKVIVHAETRALLGVHMIGGVCSEMIAQAATAIEAELRVQDLQEVVFPHPSVSEIIKDTIFEIQTL